MKKIERLLKFVSGGKILKLQPGGSIPSDVSELARIGELAAKYHITGEQARELLADDEALDNFLKDREFDQTNGFNSINERLNQSLDITEQNPISEQERIAAETRASDQSKPKSPKGTSGTSANMPWGAIGGAALALHSAVDNAVVGDKNFSAQSQAIDTAVDAAASMASQFGPWGILAAGVMKTLNSASKFAGKNVQGYDVDIKNAGYGNLGHLESEAGRVWDSWSGATARKLAKRNENARMALAAADISEDQAFEQEARTNSVTNVLQLNQIALSGGIDASLLAG